jgi:hypothetical protein
MMPSRGRTKRLLRSRRFLCAECTEAYSTSGRDLPLSPIVASSTFCTVTKRAAGLFSGMVSSKPYKTNFGTLPRRSLASLLTSLGFIPPDLIMAAKRLGVFSPLNHCLNNAATRSPASVPRAAGVATIASFKIPKISNEPNVSFYNCAAGFTALISGQHHYAKGSAQREGLTAALDVFQKKGPVEVPIVVGGKKVSPSNMTRLAQASMLTIADQNLHNSQAAKPVESLLHGRILLQRLTVRCLGRNRGRPGGQAGLGVSPIRR